MKSLAVATIFVAFCCPASCLNTNLSRRRTLECVVAGGAAWTIATPDSLATSIGSPLANRFGSETLFQPAATIYKEYNGFDNTYFPSWLAGTWNVTQTLVNVQAPLGFAFAGGPAGSESIGKQSLQESAKQLKIPVKLLLRFVKTPWGVAEDRLFNTAERLNSFAGRVVVASVDYANVADCNRESVLANGGINETPLQTTFVRFKGPAAQKSFLVSHSPPPNLDDELSNTWSGFEVQRSIFALTNTNTAPPITTDSEYLWSLRFNSGDNTVEGKFRIAGYLNPTDKLYFDAKKQAVTVQDYTLRMVRVRVE